MKVFYKILATMKKKHCAPNQKKALNENAVQNESTVGSHNMQKKPLRGFLVPIPISHFQTLTRSTSKFKK